MSKSIYDVDPIPEPVIKLMNPEAMNYLSWFMSDANNLRNWVGQIFSSDVDLNSPKLMELKNAAEISLSELEDDIAKIREFLVSYIPPNNN
jgi:hypothetical protein